MDWRVCISSLGLAFDLFASIVNKQEPSLLGELNIMSTVVGNCIPLERLRELVRDPEEANKQLIAVLLTMLDEDEEVRAWASDVLTVVEKPSSAWAPQLAELTRHVSAPVAGWSCKLLGRLGADAVRFQSSLTQALTQHAEMSVRQLAALALTSVPNLTKETIVALKAAASDADPRLRRLASEALSAQNEA